MIYKLYKNLNNYILIKLILLSCYTTNVLSFICKILAAFMGVDSQMPEDILAQIISLLNLRDSARAFMGLNRALFPMWVKVKMMEFRVGFYVKREHSVQQQKEGLMQFYRFVKNVIAIHPKHELDYLVLDFPLQGFDPQVTKMIFEFGRTTRMKSLVIDLTNWENRMDFIMGLHVNIPRILLTGTMACVESLQLDACNINVLEGQEFAIRRLKF